MCITKNKNRNSSQQACHVFSCDLMHAHMHIPFGYGWPLSNFCNANSIFNQVCRHVLQYSFPLPFLFFIVCSWQKLVSSFTTSYEKSDGQIQLTLVHVFVIHKFCWTNVHTQNEDLKLLLFRNVKLWPECTKRALCPFPKLPLVYFCMQHLELTVHTRISTLMAISIMGGYLKLGQNLPSRYSSHSLITPSQVLTIFTQLKLTSLINRPHLQIY